MKSFFILSLAGILFAPLPGLEAVDIVRDGKANAVILLPENAGEVVEFAASELVKFVKEMTGATLTVSAKERTGLIPIRFGLAGEKNLNMRPDLEKALQNLKHDGFIIDAGKNGIQILSRHPTGIHFGNYYILKRFGGICFFHPATPPFIPNVKNFSIPDGITLKNAMPFRNMGLNSGNGALAAPEVREACALWNVRNGFQLDSYKPGNDPDAYAPGNNYKNSTVKKLGFVPSGHGGGHEALGCCILDTPVDRRELEREAARIRKEEAEKFSRFSKTVLNDYAKFRIISRTHPEYFGLVNGRRVPTGINLRKGDAFLEDSSMPCLSNPGTRKQMIENIAARRARYFPGMVYFQKYCCDDQSQWCECPDCMRLLKFKGPEHAENKASDYYWDFINKMAPELLKDPKMNVNVMIYRDYQAFPEKVKPIPRERMDVTFAYHGRCYLHALADGKCPLNRKKFAELNKWIEAGMHVGTFEYMSQTPGKSNYAFWEKPWIEDLKYFSKHNITVKSGSSVGPWAGYSSDDSYYRRNAAKSRWQIAWLSGHFMWNPDDDFETVREELFSKYYGKAWPCMKEYRTLLEDALFASNQCMGYGGGGTLFASIASSPGLMEKAGRLLARAEKISENDPELLARILMDKEYFHTNYMEAGIGANASGSVRIEKTLPPVRIDGKLDEPSYLKAAAENDFRCHRPGDTAKKGDKHFPYLTNVKFLYDDKNLYIGAESRKPPAGEVDFKGDDTPFEAMKGANLQFEITSPALKGKYYHIALSHNGLRYSALTENGKTRDLADKLDFESKITDLPDRWIAEIRIPADKLGGIKDGDCWKINAARFAPGKGLTYGTLSGYGMHSPDFWKTFCFGGNGPIVRNGSFEEIAAPPAQKANGANWKFNSEKVPLHWIYQANGGSAESRSDNPGEGKRLLRISPPKPGYPAFLIQNLSPGASANRKILLAMKIRGKGAVEPYLVPLVSQKGAKNSYGKKLFRGKEKEWTQITHLIEHDAQGALRLFLRVTENFLDIDAVSLVPVK